MNVFRIELEKTRQAFKVASTFFEKCELRSMNEAVASHAGDVGLSHVAVAQTQKGVTEKSHWILRSPQHHSIISLALFVLNFAKYSALCGRCFRQLQLRPFEPRLQPVGIPLFPNSLTHADPRFSMNE